MMDRWQLAQMMAMGPDINRSRPPIQMPPPAAPQVMTQEQQMLRQQPRSAGPNPMSAIGDTLQNAFIQRAMQQNAGLKGAGMNNDFGPEGIPFGDWMNMR